MKMSLAICLLLPAASAAVADLTADVRCREIRFSRAAEAKDAALFASFIDDDARFVGSEVMRGPDDVAAAWNVFFAADGPSIMWRPQYVEVLDDGTLALTRGPYRVLAKNADGNPVEHWGTFNSVWRLQDDGSWKVVFDTGSPAAAAPDDDVRALLDQGDDCAA